MNVLTRWASAGAVLAAALLSASEAQAERIVLLQFGGRKASVLRDKVAEALETAGHTVVRSKAGSRASRATIRRVGRRSDAVLGGRVLRARQGEWKFALILRDAKKGTQIGDNIEFESEWLPGLTKDLSDNVSRRVEAVLAGEEDLPVAPAPPEPDPVAELAEAAAEPASSPDLSAEPAADPDASFVASTDDGVSDSGASEAQEEESEGLVVKLRARGGFVRRNMDFSDDIYDRLRRQGTNIWVYQAQGELYPFERPIGQRLGLILSYEGAFSGSVRDTDFGVTYPVQFQEFFGGVRARHPLGDHEVGFDLTFGQMRSGLDDSNGSADIPDLSYTLLRSSLDFKLHLGPVKATGSAGFRLPLGFGEASEEEWFPRIGGYGFEASLGAEYPLTRRISLEAITSMRRYLLEMNSEPTDAVGGVAEVAGGAVDLYLSGYVGVSFTL